jgi:two-component system chemotaxis response regulator CheY
VRTCLIVDDSRVIRRVARRILEGLGYFVEEAADGAEAMALCRNRLPEAVLLDWNMPVMDGLEFLVALRREPGGAAPLVVLCTTRNDPQHIAAALAAGADEYIMKPFDGDIIEAKFAEASLAR